MNPKTAKKALKDAIQAMTDYKWLFSATACETIITNLDASAFPLPKASVQQSVCWNPAGSIWKAG